MAWSVTLAHMRGYIGDEDRDEWFKLAGQVGLSVDHPLLTDELILEANEAIKKTRDGLQRFVLAKPLGKCVFANDISEDEFIKSLAVHKAYVKKIGRGDGVGLDAYADAGDLGADPEKLLKERKAAEASKTNGAAKPIVPAQNGAAQAVTA